MGLPHLNLAILGLRALVDAGDGKLGSGRRGGHVLAVRRVLGARLRAAIRGESRLGEERPGHKRDANDAQSVARSSAIIVHRLDVTRIRESAGFESRQDSRVGRVR